MFEALARIAEVKIREAIENGEFENLPGKGKPLEIDNMSFVPAELRMAFRIIKNAGLVPMEVSLNKEMETLKKKIEESTDETERKTLKRKLIELDVRYNILRERNITRK
ncbi:MAG TPA: DUF1992 domain-containing protein [Desulfotomaculum sp.]|nr:MAG: hypothetical protein XD84_1310 [Desulfotomaculum sp. 46_80]HAG09842.1 DUF1992 domain-containing protein [Desulfotomaculum sp.]HBY03883.1 DUF1992 domain-containing protein [Desulfotomaculum sp.]